MLSRWPCPQFLSNYHLLPLIFTKAILSEIEQTAEVWFSNPDKAHLLSLPSSGVWFGWFGSRNLGLSAFSDPGLDCRPSEQDLLWRWLQEVLAWEEHLSMNQIVDGLPLELDPAA